MNFFGTPGEGIHKTRLLGLAFYDVLFTVVASCVISYYTNYSIVLTLVTLFVIGEFLHYLFNVKTPIIKFISHLLHIQSS